MLFLYFLLWNLISQTHNAVGLIIPKNNILEKPLLNPNLNNWHCVGVYEKIDFSKPYVFKIGELPLVLWKNGEGGFSTILFHARFP